MESYGETVRFRLENLISNVKNIRNKNELIDVTLVGDDGIHIGAHMIMLSACSSFFRNIFLNMKHRHPMLYLRGMKSLNISAVLDFIYQGEVQVHHEHLQNFLDMAYDLGIEGLTNLMSQKKTQEKNDSAKTMEDKTEKESEEENDSVEYPIANIEREAYDLSGLIEDFVDQFSAGENAVVKYESLSMEEVDAPSFHHEEVIASDGFSSMDKEHPLAISINKEIDEIIRAVGNGLWACVRCGKIMRKKQHIKNHAESHLSGYSHPCQFCGKRSRTRNALSNHISYFHKKPFPPTGAEGLLFV